EPLTSTGDDSDLPVEVHLRPYPSRRGVHAVIRDRLVGTPGLNTTDLRCSGSREAVTWGFLLGCGMVPGVFCSREGLLVGVGYRIRARPGVPRAFLPACRR